MSAFSGGRSKRLIDTNIVSEVTLRHAQADIVYAEGLANREEMELINRSLRVPTMLAQVSSSKTTSISEHFHFLVSVSLSYSLSSYFPPTISHILCFIDSFPYSVVISLTNLKVERPNVHVHSAREAGGCLGLAIYCDTN
eukprot:768522-Hanusia_phi.AAC.7